MIKYDLKLRHHQRRPWLSEQMTYANSLLHKLSRALPGRVVVIGAGTIGPDIGYYLKSAISELTLHLVDVAQAPLDRAVERFKNYARKGGRARHDERGPDEVARLLVETIAKILRASKSLHLAVARREYGRR